MKLTEENYVKQAAKVMQVLCNKTDKRGKKVSPVTTSKIRNLLAMTADIYNEVVNRWRLYLQKLRDKSII